jgi:dihydrofolate reductase
MLPFRASLGYDDAVARNSSLISRRGGRLNPYSTRQSTERSTTMGKIVVTTNMTLDGAVQDPDGQEDFERGGWFAEFGGTDLDAWARLETDEALGAQALLLGRRSDDWFASRWSSRSGEWADRLNTLPKYVVSSTLAQTRWSNGTVLGGDVVDEVSALKRELDGEILVYASYQLARMLLEHDLVDELRLVVFPAVLGGGERLFGETSNAKPMRLLGTRTVGDGLIHLTYEPVRVALTP